MSEEWKVPSRTADRNHEGPNGAERDPSGRDRLPWNVITSWGGHLVFIAAGFILPRVIDRHIGQTALGIWDFSWSLVSYFGLAGLGIGSSVNRYVARYRAVADVVNVRRFVSTVVCIQLAVGCFVLLLTGGILLALPRFFSQKLGSEIDTARWVLVFLGGGLAVEMAFDAFRGVITGCHRWDIHNGINSASRGFAVSAMLVAMSIGGGLRSLAAINFFTIVVTEIVRIYVAHRVCPELRIRFADAGLPEAREMIVFGGKTIVSWLSPLILLQGSSILVTLHIGAAALAVYARPLSLLRSSQTFINKFAFVLTPTAGFLQSSGQQDDLRKLLIETSRYSAYLVLPIVAFLTFLAGPILKVWMGPRYEHGIIMAVLAIGHLLPMTHRPAKMILIGLNRHGRFGLVSTAVALCGMAVGFSIFGMIGWTLVGVALLVAIPLSIGEGIIVSLYTCKWLHIPYAEYLKEAYSKPLCCAVPFVLALVVIRVTVVENPLSAIALGCVAGPLILGPLYWRYAIPAGYREKILERLGRFERARSRPVNVDPKDA